MTLESILRTESRLSIGKKLKTYVVFSISFAQQGLAGLYCKEGF